MVRGFAWGVFAVLVLSSFLSTVLFLPNGPSQGPMKIWEAYGRGHITITQVDLTYDRNGVTVTVPVGYRVSSNAPVAVVIDEPGMLMSPSPAQFAVDPNEPTTQDGSFTAATISPGSSLTFSYADEHVQGFLPAPAWWCTEGFQHTRRDVSILLGGEILPTALQTITASPYHDSDTKNTQEDLWDYLKTYPTVVVGKTPLWKEIPGTAGQVIPVTVTATNIAVEDANDAFHTQVDARGAVVSDRIPAGWSVVPGSFSVTPTRTIDNADGSKTLEWVVNIPAANVTGRTPDDLGKPTPYNGIKLRYRLETPRLAAGRVELARAQVDTNADGTVDAHSAIPIVDVFRVNNAPTAAAGGPYSGVEGTPIRFDASASSDPDGDLLQFRWDYESDGTWDTDWSRSPTSPPLTFGDDASGTVRVEVSDGELSSIATAAYVIVNAPPRIDSVAIAGAEEGAPTTVTVAFSDPGWLDTHTAFIDWGTGEMETLAVDSTHDPPAATGTFTLTHTYGDDFDYAGMVAILDDNGGSVVRDLSVPVANIAPTVSSADVEVFVEADVCLRVAGDSWHTVRLDLFEDGALAGSVSVTRSQGSPNEQARCVVVEVDLLAPHFFEAVVTFEPEPDAKKGSDSVWLLVHPMRTPLTPGSAVVRMHHVFHVGDPTTYAWTVPLPGLAAKLIGGCGCDEEDEDDDEDEDDCDDEDEDEEDEDDEDCDDRDDEDDEDEDPECPGGIGSGLLSPGDCDEEDKSDDDPCPDGFGSIILSSECDEDDEDDDEDDEDCPDEASDDSCEDEDEDECDDDSDDDDEDESEDDDDEDDEDDDDCAGIQVHFRVTARDPGTDDISFTWNFSDGTLETRTYFNNRVSPDPRPSPAGVRPFAATDTPTHSWFRPCGRTITLTVADDDGGITVVVLTIQP